MELYKRVSREEMEAGEKVQYVGVYALKWGALAGPTDGFVEIENDELLQELKDRKLLIPLLPDRRKKGGTRCQNKQKRQ